MEGCVFVERVCPRQQSHPECAESLESTRLLRYDRQARDTALDAPAAYLLRLSGDLEDGTELYPGCRGGEEIRQPMRA